MYRNEKKIWFSINIFIILNSIDTQKQNEKQNLQLCIISAFLREEFLIYMTGFTKYGFKFFPV